MLVFNVLTSWCVISENESTRLASANCEEDQISDDENQPKQYTELTPVPNYYTSPSSPLRSDTGDILYRCRNCGHVWDGKH